MFLSKKTPSYEDYRKVKSTFESEQIDNAKITLVLDKIDEYIKTYPMSAKYAYELRKLFLLRLRFSFDKNVDINLINAIDKINEHAKSLFDSKEYADDSQEEKVILTESYKKISSYQLIKTVENSIKESSSPNDIYAIVKKISEVCKPSPIESHTPIPS